MSKGLRLSEKWFQRGLWLVAFVFAGFLIGLGGKVVDNLQLAEPPIEAERYADAARAQQLHATLAEADKKLGAASAQLEQARLKLNVAQTNYRTAHDTYENWLATRQTTVRPEQDPEIVARTRELDKLKAEERKAQAEVEALEQAHLDASQLRDKAGHEWEEMMRPAQARADAEARKAELRVFGYRLALTLPLLLVAAWLFIKKRKGMYWPFVWGFIFFALFAFFVELVPYLPSYGGYVRYSVGIILTVVVGRYAILALQRYLARQKEAEALPEEQRREELSYDVAMARLSKSVCPGCERAVDLKDPAIDYCPHCGIGLFDRCGKCSTRKNAFSRFCYSCGTQAHAS